MTLMDLREKTAGVNSVTRIKSKEVANKTESTDKQKKCLDPKNLIKRKRLSRSSERKRIPEKEENYESVDQDEVAQDLRDNFPIIKDKFDVLSKVGEGTFSKVYLARIKSYPKERVAVKHIVPTSSPTRVKNELSCLQRLGDNHNIIGVKTTLRNNDHTAFILPYFKHEKFQTYFRRLSVGEIKDYMRNLFTALKQVHNYNIIHRDVKPSNFLHSRKTKRYLLVDFGLAMQVPGTSGILSSTDDVSACSTIKQKDNSRNSQQQLTTNIVKNGTTRGESSSRETAKQKSTNKSKSSLLCKHGNQPGHSPKSVCSFCCARSGQVAPRAGTPGFRSPEVLMKLPNQTTAVDIWSAGVILLSFLSGRYPFFKAKDDLTSLAQIITVFGSKEATAAGDLLGKDLICSPSVPGCDLKSMCERLRQKTCQYHATKRNKRKYSLRDGVSKRAKIDTSGSEAERKCKDLNFEAESLSVEEIGVVYSNETKLNETRSLAERINECQSSSKRTSSKNRNKLDINKRPFDNNHVDSRRVLSSSSSECSTITAEQRISAKASNEYKTISNNFDCFCIPDEAYDLLSQCLQLDPSQRITAADALRHSFLVS